MLASTEPSLLSLWPSLLICSVESSPETALATISEKIGNQLVHLAPPRLQGSNWTNSVLHRSEPNFAFGGSSFSTCLMAVKSVTQLVAIIRKNKQNFKQLWVLRCGHSHDEYQMYIWQAAIRQTAVTVSVNCAQALWSDLVNVSEIMHRRTTLPLTVTDLVSSIYLKTQVHYWWSLVQLLAPTLDQNSNVLNWHPPKLNHQSPALTLTLTTLEALLGLIIKVFSHLCRNLSAP